MELSPITRVLRRGGRILVVSGAGISVASGLPVYRGLGGLYGDENLPEGIRIEEALSADCMRRDPGLCWKYIRQLVLAGLQAEPNAAHRILAAWQERNPGLVLVTQNVDSLHVRAGSDAIELHGHLRWLDCPSCGRRLRDPDWKTLPPLPRCATCKAVIRPPVVLFDEFLPGKAVSRLQQALAQPFELGLFVGTSALFPYIQEMRDRVRSAGGLAVEINPGDTGLSPGMDLCWREDAAKAFLRLEEEGAAEEARDE